MVSLPQPAGPRLPPSLPASTRVSQSFSPQPWNSSAWRGITTAQEVERGQGGLPQGRAESSWLSPGASQPPTAASFCETHQLFSTQIDTLEANCLGHACASSVLAQGDAVGPDGWDPPLTCCVAWGRPPTSLRRTSGLVAGTASCPPTWSLPFYSITTPNV